MAITPPPPPSSICYTVSVPTYYNLPTYPSAGDIVFVDDIRCTYVWTGHSWTLIHGSVPPPVHRAPTQEELDEYPSLAHAWEEYLVVKKLLGLP